MSYIRGIVDRSIYARGSFHVLAFSILESEDLAPKSTRTSGHLFGLEQVPRGVVLELEGSWFRHHKYGREFKVTGWRAWARHALDVSKFMQLAVSVFKDVMLLERFTEHFGPESYAALANQTMARSFTEDLAVLAEIDLACEQWQRIRGIATLSDSLQEYKLSAELINAVFEKFGEQAAEIIADNPYRLVEVEGVAFQSADRIAVRQGVEACDRRRVAAAVLWVLRDQTRQFGHLFVKSSVIAPMLEDLVHRTGVLPFDAVDLDATIDRGIEELTANGAVVVDPDVGVYLSDMHLFERSGAAMLSALLSPSGLELDLDAFLVEYQTLNRISLSELQREAVAKLLTSKVLVVTGAPGTGKTTLIKAFVQVFRTLGVSFSLMAPTGIAAKRLAHVTGVAASTIHRALGYDGFQWGFGSHRKLEVDAVIVDETSMLDQALSFRLLDALESSTMLVLVGDDAQLPSVGPGNVLRELIACSYVPTTRLETVFRQAETSDIVWAAHNIRRGESPLNVPLKTATEFQFVASSNEPKICDLIVQMAVKLKARDANFQVLAPKYDGTLGVDNLNVKLRDALNPDQGQPSCNLLDLNIRVGDRLMIVKNDYRLNVYNGDIGKLLEVGRDTLRVKVHGIGSHPDAIVEIPKAKAVSILKLAYCVTVHKSQGEEFETVILPLVEGHGRMLQRNLFYTAITRARKKVYVIGDVSAVERAVSNARVQHRNTVLRSLVVPACTSDRGGTELLDEHG